MISLVSIEGVVWVFLSYLPLESLSITYVRETPLEMSSLSLCNTLGVHYFGIK